LRLKGAAGGELLHDVAQLIGDVHVALRVYRDRLGEAQDAFGALPNDLCGGVWTRGATSAGTAFRVCDRGARAAKPAEPGEGAGERCG